ncbi:MAG: flagellar basal body rod protein FlgC [Termitinemataceae bacterium]|nr:MAG: flagellar basal body rod protein FlgC [Termitinemataceae bacterium]
MGLFNSIDIASSGLTAQRLRTDVIANNIANISTERTPEGGPFKRSRVIMRPRTQQAYWRSPFLPNGMDNGGGTGVRVSEIQKDTSTESRWRYDPDHPDAKKTGDHIGYVEMPNVDIVQEMTDMISATRAYEANASVIEGSKSMFQRALDIGRR